MTAYAPSGDAGEPRYSAEEVIRLIEGLSAQDLWSIEEAARYFAPRSGMAYDYLQQEALVRVMDTRTCKVGTDIVGFICGTIKSIASDAYRATKRARAREDEGASGEVAYVGDLAVLDQAAVDETLSPEDEALDRLYYKREVDRAMAAIADDEELQLLVAGLDDGLFGKDLEELLGTDTKGLAACRKRLARRLAGAFPAGAPL